MDLTEFYAARLDETEAAARDSYYEGQRWITEEEGVYRWPDDELVQMADRKADARHIARHDPARVLREVEAGRKILADLPAYSKQRRDLRDHVYLPENAAYHSGHADGTDDAAYYALRLLAAVYSDHPDYDEAWRPPGN